MILTRPRLLLSPLARAPAPRCAARLASTLSPLEQYDEDVRNNKIRSDEYQRRVLGSLDGVHSALLAYRRDEARADAHVKGRQANGLLSRMFTRFRPTITDVGPRGIYMYGDVGCGKTMLMDMFYRTVPAHLTKRRLHFHAFMQGMHKMIHKFKADRTSREDPVIAATHYVAAKYDVLCLDEVAVIDVADAMILRHIWEVMYKDGMTTFMTSNRHPDELYLNGVQRQSFLPAIELIKERNHVIFLDSPTDYRKLPRPESGTYYFESEHAADGAAADGAAGAVGGAGGGASAGARKHAERWFEFFAQGAPATASRDLVIWGRPVPIPLSAGDRVMQFTFMELCGEPRSAADYLEMCRTFPAAVITDIPLISMEQRDLIRRLITFLDAAYDSHTKLAVTAARPFHELFNTASLRINPHTNKVELVGATGAAKVDLANFAGQEEMFAFARALSRLKQMSSAEWLDYERD